jgi:hypothetical protein
VFRRESESYEQEVGESPFCTYPLSKTLQLALHKVYCWISIELLLISEI